MSEAARNHALSPHDVLRRPLPWIVAIFASVLIASDIPWNATALAVVATTFVVTLLAFIDLKTRRLPNAVVLPTGVGIAVWLVFVAAVHHQWLPLLAAFIGGLALGAIYLLLALISRGGMGGGDVKVAAVLGLSGGWYGLHAWSWVLLAPFVVGGLLAVLGLSLRRLSWTGQLPFGPALAAGYVVAAVVTF